MHTYMYAEVTIVLQTELQQTSASPYFLMSNKLRISVCKYQPCQKWYKLKCNRQVQLLRFRVKQDGNTRTIPTVPVCYIYCIQCSDVSQDKPCFPLGTHSISGLKGKQIYSVIINELYKIKQGTCK